MDHPAIVQLYSDTPTFTARARPEWSARIERVFSWSGFGNPGFAEALRGLTHAWHVAVLPFRGMEPSEHATEYYARCVGVRPECLRPSDIAFDPATALAAETAMREGARASLLIHAGSGSPSKNWQGFAEVARRWRDELGGNVFEIRGPAEQERLAPLPWTERTIATSDLRQLAAWLRAAPLYLGNDSGVSHLAAALARRSVVLFGSSDPRTWAPRGPSVRILYRPQPCSTCGPSVFCCHRLSVDDVWAALLASLSGPPGQLNGASPTGAA